MLHSGTTDVGVQVNLAIVAGAISAGRLEHALRNAEFEPTGDECGGGAPTQPAASR